MDKLKKSPSFNKHQQDNNSGLQKDSINFQQNNPFANIKNQTPIKHQSQNNQNKKKQVNFCDNQQINYSQCNNKQVYKQFSSSTQNTSNQKQQINNNTDQEEDIDSDNSFDIFECINEIENEENSKNFINKSQNYQASAFQQNKSKQLTKKEQQHINLKILNEGQQEEDDEIKFEEILQNSVNFQDKKGIKYDQQNQQQLIKKEQKTQKATKNKKDIDKEKDQKNKNKKQSKNQNKNQNKKQKNKKQRKLKVFSDAATSSDTDEYEDEIECEKEEMEEKKFIEEFGVQLNKNGYIVEEGDFDEEAENVEDIQQFHRRNQNQQKDELDYFMDEFGDVFQNQGESQESEESWEKKRKRKQKKKKKENQKRSFSDIENLDEMSQDSDFIREQKKILEQFQKKNHQSAQQQIKQQNEIESDNKSDNQKKNKKTNKSDEKYQNKRRKMKIIGNDSDSEESNYEKLQKQQNYNQNENQQIIVQENFSELSILEDEYDNQISKNKPQKNKANQKNLDVSDIFTPIKKIKYSQNKQSSQSNDFNPLLSQDSASGFQKYDQSYNKRNKNLIKNQNYNKMNEENEEETKNCFVEESKQLEEDFSDLENKESKQDKAFKRLKKKITQQKEKRKQNSKNQQKQQISTKQKRKNKHQKPLEPFQESEEINCCICFDKPENQIYGVLKCNHKYCYQCIKDWADVTNQCPMCRTEFKTILKKDFLEQYQQDIKVKNKKQKIPDHYLEEIGGGEQEQEQQGYDDYDAGIENAEDTCYKCNGQEYPENMIVCDLCDTKVCHAMCDDSIEDGTIPAGDWYCHYCREEDENFVEESSFDSSYQN